MAADQRTGVGVAAALRRLGPQRTIDAQDQRITSARLEKLLAAAPRRDGRPLLRNVNLNNATITGDAHFDGAIFTGNARFDGATFEGPARFDGATFEGLVHFDGATFQDVARFDRRVIFKGDAHFPDVTFTRDASFREATFEGDAHFDRATFKGDASFHKASLKEAFALGPMLALGRLELDGASFGGIEIRVSADKVSCERTVFHGPANLQVRWAEVALDRAAFESASLLAASDEFTALPVLDEVEQKALEALQDAERRELAPRCEGHAQVSGRTEQPRLVSLRRANVADLVVSDVDLRSCRFAGAHNLDRLRFEGAIKWPGSLDGWRWKVKPLAPRRPRSSRRTIAEEHEWRSRRRSTEDAVASEVAACDDVSARWYPKQYESPPWLGSVAETKVLHPSQIARLYRALRKGREDNKDEPGAADFYYGEMEMRRNARRRRGEPAAAARTSWPEWAILSLYWLVSGYGLRASRALIALALTVVAFAVAFDLRGFQPDQAFDRTLLFSAESISGLFRVPQLPRGVRLTEEGQWLQMALRLLGPLLFGLALLALRGRVKR
jgi:uncharacterized protein YjbI with pentapeptide repeats